MPRVLCPPRDDLRGLEKQLRDHTVLESLVCDCVCAPSVAKWFEILFRSRFADCILGQEPRRKHLKWIHIWIQVLFGDLVGFSEQACEQTNKH
jgi:hypothetical protein